MAVGQQARTAEIESPGEGPGASEPASSLVTTITGPNAALDDLSGEGADLLRARLSGR